MTAVLSFINKGTNTLPDWATKHLSGKREPNGTFMIRTIVGKNTVRARVNVGQMLIERKGVAYSCHPGEAKAFLAELEEIETRAYAMLPKTADVPGAKLEAPEADRADDTDEISRRITAEKRAAGLEKNQQPAGQKARVSAVKEVEIPRGAATPPAPFKSNPPLGMPPSIEMRHPNELQIDDSYQRSIDTPSSQALIKRIASGWDWRMCLPLVVSRREAGFFVIDGQHRLAAAQMRGDIPFLPCCISTYGSIAEEASLFVALNRARRAINRLDDHHAAVAGGDPESLKIHRLITDAGFTVARRTGSQSWVPGEVAFTATVRKVMRKHGEKVCADALRLMSEAFPDEVLNAGASVFMALTKIAFNQQAPDEERLLRALLTLDQKGWASLVADIRGGGEDRALGLKKALLMSYEDAA